MVYALLRTRGKRVLTDVRGWGWSKSRWLRLNTQDFVYRIKKSTSKIFTYFKNSSLAGTSLELVWFISLKLVVPKSYRLSFGLNIRLCGVWLWFFWKKFETTQFSVFQVWLQEVHGNTGEKLFTINLVIQEKMTA